jgi:tetratricopeptide (TPR) repeat protein
LFAGGLMSKPMLVTLPFLLLLLDFWPLRRTGSWRLLAWEKVPFLLLSAAVCVVTVLAQKDTAALFQNLPLPWRIGNALVAYTDYIGQMFWPAGLAVLYPHPGYHLPLWKIGLSALILSMITAGVAAGWRKRPYLLVGWLWYLGMLVPVIGLMQVGSQARADRYTYLPQIGLYIMVAWGVMELSGSWRYRRVVLGSAGVAIVAGLMAVAYAQTGYWKDSIALWTHTLACTTNNAIAHKCLGDAWTRQGKLDEAVQQYDQALLFYPDFADAHNNLGSVLARQGNTDKAIQQFKQAIRLNPGYAVAYNNLGNALARQGNFDEAIQQYRQAIRLNPNSAEAHNALGIALAREGNFDEAVQQHEQALQLNPDYAQAHNSLGNALARQGKLDEAIQQYRQALQLNPGNMEAHYNLGNALALQGRMEEAAQQFQQALDLAVAQNDLPHAALIRARLGAFTPASPQPQSP